MTPDQERQQCRRDFDEWAKGKLAIPGGTKPSFETFDAGWQARARLSAEPVLPMAESNSVTFDSLDDPEAIEQCPYCHGYHRGGCHVKPAAPPVEKGMTAEQFDKQIFGYHGEPCDRYRFAEAFASAQSDELRARITALTKENNRLLDAWMQDETVGITDGHDDGTLRPSIRKTVERAEKAEQELAQWAERYDEQVKFLQDRAHDYCLRMEAALKERNEAQQEIARLREEGKP